MLKIVSMISAVTLLATASTFSAERELPDDVIAAAKAEGRVTVYTGWPQLEAQAVAAAFEEKYGITVDVFRSQMGTISSRFQTEVEQKTYNADVISLPSTPFFEDNPDWFLPVSEEILPIIADYAKGTIWPHFVALNYSVFSVIYNTNMIAENDVPRTWDDLVNPALKGKLMVPTPIGNESYMGAFSTLLEIKGEDYLRALHDLDLMVATGGGAGAQQVAAGKAPFIAPNYVSFAQPLIDAGAPIGVTYLEEPRLSGITHIALAANPPHPAAARLFVNWYLSEDAVKVRCRTTPISTGDLEGKFGCDPVPELPIITNPKPSDETRAKVLELLGIN